MSGPSITEFLEARLAELEAEVNENRPHLDCDWSAAEWWRECNCHFGAYVLADIAAKRAILAEYTNALATLEGEYEMDSDSVPAWQERVWALEPVVHLLAAPFANHEHFDPEWSVGEPQPCGDELWEGQ